MHTEIEVLIQAKEQPGLNPTEVFEKKKKNDKDSSTTLYAVTKTSSERTIEDWVFVRCKVIITFTVTVRNYCIYLKLLINKV